MLFVFCGSGDKLVAMYVPHTLSVYKEIIFVAASLRCVLLPIHIYIHNMPTVLANMG